jgi:hypothetical protein
MTETPEKPAEPVDCHDEPKLTAEEWAAVAELDDAEDDD